MEINNKTEHFNRQDLVSKIGEDEEFIQMLLSTYFESYNQYYQGIMEAFESGDAKKFKLNAHSLKGSSYSACIEIMGNIAAALDKSDVSEVEKIKDLMLQLNAEREYLRKLLGM